MDKDTRNAIERATQRARKLLEEDFASQLEGTFDVLRSGVVAAKAGPHLSTRLVLQRDKIVAAIEHKRAAGMKIAEAVEDYLRDAAFTALNRFVALKMLEARELLQECITRGEQSSGYREFCGMAPGLALLPESAGYRLYIESLFDELSTEVKVLFDRRDPASVLWPRRATFDALLELLNTTELAGVWGEDETIGWVYQFFNSGDERRAMRAASPAPQNSRELAVRNQFFTPRYVVQFLTDNTLGRIWYEMSRGETALAERCEYLVRKPKEIHLRKPSGGPEPASLDGALAGEMQPNGTLEGVTIVPYRVKKDPRDLRVLDPACGSGHFLLYAFDLLLVAYEEAWADDESPASEVTGATLRADYPEIEALRRAIPALVLRHNLHGIDIDARCAQIAQLALWMRAQRAYRDAGIARPERAPIRRSNIVVAEPIAADAAMVARFTETLRPPLFGKLVAAMVERMKLAGELGSLFAVEAELSGVIADARKEYQKLRGQSGWLPGLGVEPPQAELDFSGITGDRFFQEADEKIRGALEEFAVSAAAGEGARRRMFADDAAHGLGFLELARKKYDVLLMNPPFGAGSARAKKDFEKTYPKTKNDVYAAFVERGIGLLHGRGRLGAITSRTGFFLSSFQKWREEILLAKAPPVVFADLGAGVLDSAMVETAAYCLEVRP